MLAVAYGSAPRSMIHEAFPVFLWMGVNGQGRGKSPQDVAWVYKTWSETSDCKQSFKDRVGVLMRIAGLGWSQIHNDIICSI